MLTIIVVTGMRRLLVVLAGLAAPALALAAPYSDAVEAEGTLLHYWKMDEAGGTTLTATTGGVNLTVVGATVGDNSGPLGNAVSFDGVNDCAVTAANLDFTAQPRITVEYLVRYPTGAYNAADRVGHEFGPGTVGVGEFMWVPENSGGGAGSHVTWHTGNVGVSYAQYTPQISVDTWHHVVFDYDFTAATNEVSFYSDGALVTPSARPVNSNNTSTGFVNGKFNLMSRACDTIPAVYFMAGKVQHLAIYSGLSAARILAHYNLTVRNSYTFVAADFWANGYDNVAAPRQSNMARAVITTASPTLYVTGTSDFYGINPAYAELYVLQNGTLLDTLNFAADGQEEFTVTLGSAGTSKTVEIVNGVHNFISPDHFGSDIDAVAVPSAYTVTVVPPVAPGDRVVFYGDSIISGGNADNLSPEGVTERLRTVYGISTMQEAWGVRSLYDDRASDFAPLASRIAGYSPATVWVAIGVNDWQYGNYTLANFGTAYQTMLTALQTAMPGARIICQTPTSKDTEPTPNGEPVTLEQWRGAIRTACANRGLQVVEGPDMFDVADTDDGLHPDTQGHSDYADNIYPYLAPRRGGGGLGLNWRSSRGLGKGAIR